jgi:hypothetical protein
MSVSVDILFLSLHHSIYLSKAQIDLAKELGRQFDGKHKPLC